MAKLTLTDITSGYQTASTTNANNAAIEAALENTLSRDGTAPNSMSADLDMNSYAINNLPDAVSNQQPVTLSQAATIAGVTNALTRDTVGAVFFPTTTEETNASITPANNYYPEADWRRYTIADDGTTNVKAVVTFVIERAADLGIPVYIPKPATAYFLGALGDDESVIDLTGKAGVRIHGQEALFTFTPPSTTSARVIDLANVQGCWISGLKFKDNSYTIASNGTTGVIAVGTDESATTQCENINVQIEAEACRSGFEINRPSSGVHSNMVIDIRTVNTYYGAVFAGSGAGEQVRGNIYTQGAVRSYFIYEVKDHDVTVVSSSVNSTSTGDVLIKAYTDAKTTENITIKATFTGAANSANNAVKIETDMSSTDTSTIENIDIWMDDTGNSSGGSVLFNALRSSSNEDPTTCTIDNIKISGVLRQVPGFTTKPNSGTFLVSLDIENDFAADLNGWSTDLAGWVFKIGDTYCQFQKGTLTTVDIPVGRFADSTADLCIEVDIATVGDRGQTSSSAWRAERFLVLGYMSGGSFSIRTSASQYNINTTANVTHSLSASSANLRNTHGGSSMTSDAATTVKWRYL